MPVGKNLDRRQGLVDGDGVHDSSLYFERHGVVVDALGRSASEAAFLVRGVGADNAPVALFRVNKDGTIVSGVAGLVAGGVVDNSAAIQAALDAADAAANYQPQTLVLPPGNYLIKTGLTFSGNQGLRLIGHGATLTAGTAGITMLTLGKNTAPTAFATNMDIQGLRLDGASLSNVTGLAVQNCHDSSFRNITIENCATTGLDIQDETFSLLFESCQTQLCGRGCYVHVSAQAFINDKLHFVNCEFFDSVTENVLLDGPATATFIGGSYEKGTTGISITGNSRNVGIYGGHFESNSTADIDCYKNAASSAAASVGGLTIKGGWFTGLSTMPLAIQLKGAVGVDISGIWTEGHTTGINATDSGQTVQLNSNISIKDCEMRDTAAFSGVDGVIAFRASAPISRIVGGSTSLSLRNNANTADNLLLADAGTVTRRGETYIGDTSNAFQTLGVTINQAGADDEIVSLKSSDVAHGETTDTETDTFGAFSKIQTTGGLRADGYGAGTVALQAFGTVTTAVTTKATASGAAVLIDGALKSGTTRAALGANANVLAIRNNASAVALVDADGDVFALRRFYPGTDAGAFQELVGLSGGSGAPNNANGTNGDIYFRSDGGALTTVYQRRSGTWIGIV